MNRQISLRLNTSVLAIALLLAPGLIAAQAAKPPRLVLQITVDGLRGDLPGLRHRSHPLERGQPLPACERGAGHRGDDHEADRRPGPDPRADLDQQRELHERDRDEEEVDAAHSREDSTVRTPYKMGREDGGEP